MASTLVKVAGVAAAFGLGWLIFRPKKSQAAASGGCFDQQGVRAWGIQENLDLVLIRSQHDLALVPSNGSIDALVIGDTCEVWTYRSDIQKFRPDAQRTQGLRDFLVSLVPVQGQTAGVQWLI